MKIKHSPFIAILAVSIIIISFLLLSGCQKKDKSPDKKGTISAKFASEEIEGDFMTVWAKNFAQYMEKETGGKMKISVYPYGSLGDTRDINELAQLGVMDFVFTDFAWVSSFVPQAQVLALHYVWPREKTAHILEWVVKNGEFMPMLEKAFRKKKLVPLGIMYEGWQWLTSKVETSELEDLDGLKTRLMGSKLLVENYRTYGISPTPMSYGEVYSGLQTGLIDAQVNPLFADYSMKFYEVTDYFTQMWAEPFLSIPAVNREFFDSLPEEMQKKMKDYFRDRIVEAGNWIDNRNRQDSLKIENEKESVVWTEWDKEEIEKARKRVIPLRKTKYPQYAGENAEEILDALLSDIEKAKAALKKEKK